MMTVKKEERPLRSLLIGLSRRWVSSVLSFRDGSNGALGLPIPVMVMGSDSHEPSPVPGLPPDVSSVAAGHDHSLAVTSQGHLWAWGHNSETQLGRGIHSPSCGRETWYERKRVEGLDQVSVRNAFASGVISAVVGVDGSLWVWGKSKCGQLCLGKGITEAAIPSRVDVFTAQEIAKVVSYHS